MSSIAVPLTFAATMEALPQLADAALGEGSFSSVGDDYMPTMPDQPLRSRKIRARQACLQCRSHKIRCLDPEPSPDENKNNMACRRCQKFKIPCTYTGDRRIDRRKPYGTFTNTQPSSSAMAPSQPHSNPFAVPPHPASDVISNDAALQAFAAASSFPPLPMPLPQLATQPDTAYHPRQTQPLQPSPYSTSSSIPVIAGSSVIEAQQDSLGDGSAANCASLVEAIATAPHRKQGSAISLLHIVNREAPTSRADGPDAVDLDILNMFEASFLFKQFHANLGIYINMFEPDYNSAEAVRGLSATLFSAILSIAAKFFRRALYPSLLSHTKQLVTRSLLEGHYDLYLVQAIFLLVHWREVTDRSAFVNTGIAIRIGLQLGLHTAQGTAKLGSEATQAASRARERTWYQCICYDQNYRIRASKNRFYTPAMIPMELVPQTMSSWINLSPENLSDTQLSFSVELVRLLRIVECAFASEDTPDLTLSYHFSLLDSFRQRWIDGPTAFAWDPIRSAKSRWAYWFMTFRVRTSLVTRQYAEAYMSELLLTTEQSIQAVETVCSLDMLNFLPDSIAFQLFYLGERICMLRSMVAPGMHGTLIQWLQRVLAAARSTKSQGDDKTAFYVIKYFETLVAEVRNPGHTSRVPSRASSPQPPAPQMPLVGPQLDAGDGFSAWINGLDIDWSAPVQPSETDYMSLRQNFAQDVNWLEMLGVVQ